MNVVKAIGFTLLIAIIVVMMIAMLYVTVWVMVAVAILLLGSTIYKMLKVKDSLD